MKLPHRTPEDSISPPPGVDFRDPSSLSGLTGFVPIGQQILAQDQTLSSAQKQAFQSND